VLRPALSELPVLAGARPRVRAFALDEPAPLRLLVRDPLAFERPLERDVLLGFVAREELVADAARARGRAFAERPELLALRLLELRLLALPFSSEALPLDARAPPAGAPLPLPALPARLFLCCEAFPRCDAVAMTNLPQPCAS
jgi:hypothetical protein